MSKCKLIVSVSVFLFSFHLQFHDSRTHFWLPGGPIQQKDHSELWNLLLVLCDAAKLFYYQRSKCHTLFLLYKQQLKPFTQPLKGIMSMRLSFQKNLKNTNSQFLLRKRQVGSCRASWVFLEAEKQPSPQHLQSSFSFWLI